MVLYAVKYNLSCYEKYNKLEKENLVSFFLYNGIFITNSPLNLRHIASQSVVVFFKKFEKHT